MQANGVKISLRKGGRFARRLAKPAPTTARHPIFMSLGYRGDGVMGVRE